MGSCLLEAHLGLEVDCHRGFTWEDYFRKRHEAHEKRGVPQTTFPSRYIRERFLGVLGLQFALSGTSETDLRIDICTFGAWLLVFQNLGTNNITHPRLTASSPRVKITTRYVIGRFAYFELRDNHLFVSAFSSVDGFSHIFKAPTHPASYFRAGLHKAARLTNG